MEPGTPNIDVAELLRHRRFLRRLAGSLLRDDDDAEDVVQDAYLAALRRADPPRVAWGPWLAGTVRNLAKTVLRRRARRTARERRRARSEAEDTGRAAAADLEISRVLVDALLSLEEPYRTVLVLRYFRDESPRRIAARTGVPVETVRTRTKRALALLRRRLDAGHGGSRREWSGLLVSLAGPARPGLPSLFVAGGLAVKKLVVVLALVLLLAAAGWLLSPRSGGGGAGPRPDPPVVAGVGAERAGAGGTPATAGASVPAPPSGAAPAGKPPPDDVAVVAIRGPDGAPVAGAEVTLLRSALAWQANRPDEVLTRRTDASGRVRLPVIPHLRYMLKIVHPAFGVTGDLECFGGNVSEVKLAPGGAVTGTVRDRDTGRPIEGAVVYAMDSCMLGILAEWRATTDARGAYRIEGIGGGYLNMQATAPDHAVTLPGAVPVVRPGEETRVDFSLPRGIRLVFRVLDGATGKPVPGAEISYGFDGSVRGAGDRLVTDPLPPDAEVPVLVTAPGFASRAIRIDAGAAARPQDPIAVTLSRGIPVRGELRAPSGEPLAGREIQLSSVDGERSLHGTVTSVADGTFSADLGLPGAQLFLRLSLPGSGYLDRGPVPVPADATSVRLDPIVVGGEGEIHGTVTDADGAPVPRALVVVRPKSDPTGVPVGRGWVDPRGRFSIRNLPEGDLVLDLGAMDGRPDVTRDLTLGGRTEVDFRLDRGYGISGRVRDTKGRSVSLVLVVADDGLARTRTDAMGRFRFRGLPPGRHRIFLRDHPDCALSDVPGDSFDLEITVPADLR